MLDLFSTDAPQVKCGFAAFWGQIPTGAKNGKVMAEKSFRRLSPSARQAAQDNVEAYYDWWRKTNKDASWLHPTTYLNQRRWEDEAWRPATPSSAVDVVAFWADSINAGRYVSPSTCGPELCRAMVARGLVTDRQILERGLTT